MTRAGICGTRTEVGEGERRNLNSLFITMRTRHMKRIPLRMGVLNLAHEVLHSFGAEHDPNTVECGGRYIISKYSGSGDGGRFSIEIIGRLLLSGINSLYWAYR